MFGLARILLTIGASAVAMPVFAQTPAPTTSFDGTYAGISREFSKSPGAPRAKCTPNGVPPRLTIAKGAAHASGDASWEGTVSPQGALVMRLPNTLRLEGQIDPQGTIRGQAAGTGCIYTYVWRKQSG
jgi:hypothetical protein